MAIYNRSVHITRAQLLGNYLLRDSFADLLYGIIRFFIIIVQNLYCVSSYLILSWLVLLPIGWIRSDLYSKAENYLYNSLLFIVSSWSLAAGANIVEAGDEYKHLIEEPDKHYPIDQCEIKQRICQLTTNCNNNNLITKANETKNCPPEKCTSGHKDTFSYRHLRLQDQTWETSVKTSPKPESYNKAQTMQNGINGIVKNHNNNFVGRLSEKSIVNSSNNNLSSADELFDENTPSTAKSRVPRNTNNHNEDSCTGRPTEKGAAPQATTVARNISLIRRTPDDSPPLKCHRDKPRILLLCNHISTADVPLMMQSFSTLTKQSILWVLDAAFRPTNFGVVCSSHGDFFVEKKAYIDGSLRRQVLKHPDRNLLVLFPEGGFWRKRLEGSNRYATRMGLPMTKYVTHPRFGAFKDLIDPSVGVTHIVDATLLYDDIKNPLSIVDIGLGNRKEPAILNLKLYKRSEIEPTEEWLRKIWLEKDKLLQRYYEDRASVFEQFGANFRTAQLDWFKILFVHLFYLLVCYLTIFRLFNATCTTMLSARELYYSNI